MSNYLAKVICLWMILCIPGLIVVSSHIFFGRKSDVNSSAEKIMFENQKNDTEFACYEKKDDFYASNFTYKDAIRAYRFWIEGRYK